MNNIDWLGLTLRRRKIRKNHHFLLFFKLTSLLFLLAAVSCPVMADVALEKFADSDEMTIRVHGAIKDNDLKDFKAALAKVAKDKQKLHMNAVQLDSHGGERSAGMAIGHAIRNHRLNTYVATDAICHSACALIFIGGVERYPFGEIGVHRTTFFKTLPSAYDKFLPEVVGNDIKRVRAYVSKMGVSSQFSEAILSTPSWFIRAVNEREKYEWQVVGSERVHEEIAINQISRRLKIERDELMQKFEKNYDSCMNEARAFTSTVFACVESRLSNPAVQ